jgi:hypothetical protein
METIASLTNFQRTPDTQEVIGRAFDHNTAVCLLVEMGTAQ